MVDTATQFHYDAKDSANGKSKMGDVGVDSTLKTSVAKATGQALWHA